MTPTREQLVTLLKACRTIARDAGDAILQVYEHEFEVHHKDDRSPLTEADLRSHHLIVARLGALSPHFPVLSEESKFEPFSVRCGWRTYWLVDPLDGTREFVKRNGEFTVNIALIHNGEPILGVVDAPALRRSYSAARGLGAWRQDDDGSVRAIAARPLDLARLTVASSKSHRDDRLEAFHAALPAHARTIMGSSLKLCLVAEGEADLYPRLGPTSEWDTAAAQCIVEEAGGRVTDLKLQPLRYNTKESLLNPEFLVFTKSDHDWRQYLPTA
ncbi:MAG: 3'(2'),5'-bisphosphate nucleotidase CysQ [Thiotrichales bacterium]